MNYEFGPSDIIGHRIEFCIEFCISYTKKHGWERMGYSNEKWTKDSTPPEKIDMWIEVETGHDTVEMTLVSFEKFWLSDTRIRFRAVYAL